MTKRSFKRGCALLLAFLSLAGCSATGQQIDSEDAAALAKVYMDESDIGLTTLMEEAVPLAAAAALPVEWTPVASGKQVKSSDKAKIDYSNAKDGYVMVQYTASTSKKLKARVQGGNTKEIYTYNINAGEWVTFPLSAGSGSYKVTVYENVKDTKYAEVVSASFTAQLADEFAPFLRPNQYVNYQGASKTIAKAKELVGGLDDPLGKVKAVYEYVVKNLTYDKNLAASVPTGYLPDLDKVLAKKKGICFDYAALMTGMLRCQGVPCKLVVGYAGKQYHAWISVWSEETGWIDGAVYFDGTSWQRMDPTFASSSKQSEAIMKYIGDGKNYSAKYFY